LGLLEFTGLQSVMPDLSDREAAFTTLKRSMNRSEDDEGCPGGDRATSRHSGRRCWRERSD